jgi:two-component system cell cycle response regulator
VADLPGQPDVLVVGLGGHQANPWLHSVRARHPELSLVVWEDAGNFPGLSPPLERVSPSHDGSGLCVAVERCRPWVLLRAERDGARSQLAEAMRRSELIGRAAALLREPEAEGFQESLLGQLCSATQAEAGALWLADDAGGCLLRAWRGALEQEQLPQALAPDEEARALLQGGRPWRVEGQAVLWVPISARGESLGVAQLSLPGPGGFGAMAEEAALTLAEMGGAALLSARRFRALQRLALRDPDSSAYNLAYFTDYASKEIDKARRYGRGFSLVVFGLDGLPHLRARAGADQARAAVRAYTRALSRVLRESDVLARVAEQEFFLLLPETDAFGAQVFLRRALASVRDSAELRAVEQIAPVLVQGGAASFPSDGEEFDILLGSCRARLEQRRASLQRRLLLDPLGFWEAVELLLGVPDGPRLPVEDGGDPSRRGRVPEPLFDEVQTEIGRTLLREPDARSLVYLGGPEAGPSLPLVRALELAGADFLPRVYLLGRRTDVAGRAGLTPVSLAGDERLLRHEFLLWLHGASAYALLQRRGRGATWAFHTSDAALVDGLVSKLQAAYDLQPY